jgi:hypothetical protein
MICHPCKYQLEKSYQFKKKCEAADTKLRKHVKLIQQLSGQEDDDIRSPDSRSESEQVQSSSGKSRRVKQLLADLVSTKRDVTISQVEGDPIEVTEEELVGGYILGMSAENVDMDDNLSEDPANITLVPAEERSAKARCTIKGTRIKQEQDSDDETDEVQRAIVNVENKKIYMMELENQQQNQSQLQQPMHPPICKNLFLNTFVIYLIKHIFCYVKLFISYFDNLC